MCIAVEGAKQRIFDVFPVPMAETLRRGRLAGGGGKVVGAGGDG